MATVLTVRNTPFAVEYRNKEVLVPAVILDQRRQRRDKEVVAKDETKAEYITGAKTHSLLRCRSRWLEDSDVYRSSAEADHPATALLSDDPSVFWEATGAGEQWVVFDFGNLYTLTAVEFIGAYVWSLFTW